ncbi:MAG: 7-carboxy-7-deazaguanine synthase QueE [Candidatus Eremiobacteraeota bacterium]|nr:7-carboxy-7-deazaguanine synthase QueE [Candidatus Eremiobacteraeota bacterium]MBC5828299.1 7-carboxy-7-deazaguanine synthase QueE [Candidatus Eremiobacteraeota bacterium]
MPTPAAALSVNEVFSSIQGEGTFIGAPTAFIRLAGCPLRCAWCDTAYALGADTGTEREVDDLIAAVGAFRRVVITGGEPLVQDIGALVDGLAHGRHVTVETSGTIFADLPRVSLFSISPKVGSSGYRPKPLILRKYCASAAGRMQLKFVIGGDLDLAEALACVQEISDALAVGTPIILQPESGKAGNGERYGSFLRDLTEAVVADAGWRPFEVRVLPQLHYVLWGGQAGR